MAPILVEIGEQSSEMSCTSVLKYSSFSFNSDLFMYPPILHVCYFLCLLFIIICSVSSPQYHLLGIIYSMVST